MLIECLESSIITPKICIMSGIFEKTIESLNALLSPLSTSMGLSTKSMFERCMSARTKRVCESVYNRYCFIPYVLYCSMIMFKLSPCVLNLKFFETYIDDDALLVSLR